MIIDGDRFGPWALITGASSGIGEEFAHQLAHAGINVVLVARRTAELDRVGTTVAARYGVDFRTLSLDLSEPGVCDTIDTATRDIDIGLLVSNAGDGQPVSFLAEELSSQRRIVRLNVDTQLALTHLFAHRLVRRGRGGIVLVSALGASHGIPLMTNASATRATMARMFGYTMSRAAARPAARPENTQPPRKVPSSER